MTHIRGNNTFESANSIRTIERILALLKTGPQTYIQLCEKLFITDRSARRYIAHLREKPNRRVYVIRLIKVTNNYSPAFALGSKDDAERPPKQTQAYRSAQWRKRLKESKELRERMKRYEAARWLSKTAAKKPNTWFSALEIGA